MSFEYKIDLSCIKLVKYIIVGVYDYFESVTEKVLKIICKKRLTVYGTFNV